MPPWPPLTGQEHQPRPLEAVEAPEPGREAEVLLGLLEAEATKTEDVAEVSLNLDSITTLHIQIREAVSNWETISGTDYRPLPLDILPHRLNKLQPTILQCLILLLDPPQSLQSRQGPSRSLVRATLPPRMNQRRSLTMEDMAGVFAAVRIK